MADTKLEGPESYGNDKAQLYSREIAAARKELEKFWKQGEAAHDRFLDTTESSGTRMNLFWSDTNVLASAIYSKPPKASVSRRNKDPHDDVGRVAGEMVERILNLDMDSQSGDIDVALKQAVEDRLVQGLGQVWLRYDPTFDKQPNPTFGAAPAPPNPLGEPAAPGAGPGIPMPAQPQPAVPPVPMPAQPQPAVPPVPMPEPEIEVITDEKVPTDHVHWKDFLWSPARTWKEVRWVARAIYMTRGELVKKFGEDIGNQVPLNASKDTDQQTISRNDPWQKACVWEIWNKDERSVCWYVEGYRDTLGESEDPLGLDGFFPCPEPFVANVTTSSTVPKPDHEMLRSKYDELDVVSNRCSLLEDAIRVIGVYNAAVPELGKILERGRAQNVMVPADNWAMFAEKGGIKGSTEWFPIDMVVEALLRLRETKVSIMADLRELRGISDIMRGETKAQETLGAQQLKAQFGSVRLQHFQGELAKFVQQTLSIKAEIIAAHFQPDTIKRQSLIDKTPDAQLADKAIQLLKDKRMAMYALAVDPDTMAQVDYADEQKSRGEFITAIGQFMTAAFPLAQAKPESIPFLLQLMQWFLASFKGSREIEGVLDQAVRMMMQAPQKPDPYQEAVKGQQLRGLKGKADKDESAAVLNVANAKAKEAEPMIKLVEAMKPEPQPQFPGGAQ